MKLGQRRTGALGYLKGPSSSSGLVMTIVVVVVVVVIMLIMMTTVTGRIKLFKILQFKTRKQATTAEKPTKCKESCITMVDFSRVVIEIRWRGDIQA